MQVRISPRQWVPDIECTYCCDEMKEAWEEDFIGIGDYGESLRSRRDCEVNIYNCSPYPEGAVWESMKIERCPWCGEVITIDASEMPA